MTDLTDLIARVEALEGADREVDGLIEIAVRGIEAARLDIKPEHRAKWRSDPAGHVRDGHTNYVAARFTSSLDAALALARHVLPQCRVLVESDHQDLGWAMVCAEPGAPRDMTDAPTPALALLLALLRALQSATTKEREE